MQYVKRKDWNIFNEEDRIKNTYDPNEIVSEVFTGERRKSFVNALGCILPVVDELELSGNTMRQKLGCTRIDLTDRLGYLVDSLEFYQRLILGDLTIDTLTKHSRDFGLPDLDFTIWGTKIETIQKILHQHKFCAAIQTVTGGIQILKIKGDSGQASFVEGEESLHTSDIWPRYSAKLKAKLGAKPTGGLEFTTDIAPENIYYCPLEIPGIHLLEPTDHIRFAATWRAIIYSMLEKDPKGNFLTLPSLSTTIGMRETVSQTYSLLVAIERGEKEKQLYRGSMRDAAFGACVLDQYWEFYDSDFHRLMANAYRVGKIESGSR